MLAPTAGRYPRPLFRLSALPLRALALAMLLALALGALTAPGTLPPTTAPAATLADLPVAAQAALSASLGRDDAAYHASAQAGEVTLANAGHGLHAGFDAAGLTLKVGASSGTLTLRGYGYGKALQAPRAATPTAEANRVAYARGDLSEWYVNGPLGLEQGFTLAQAPAGPRGGPLALALAFSGWRATVDASGQGALLTGDAGAQLRYGGLFAYDADGRALPAWMEQRGAELWLRVDDAGARYPLVIDPAITEPKLTASDGATFESLGFSVAIDGDTIVVGAYLASVGGNAFQGAAYVFDRPAGGWASATETARLTASDGVAEARLGYAVAISGDTIVVGAIRASVGGNSNQGAAYVYVKPAAGWASATETARLTASDGATFDTFGQAVAIDGDTIVVGATDDNPGAFDFPGAAYVYVRPAGGWASATESAKLTASDLAPYYNFGYSVAIDGDTVVVGATGATAGGTANQGAAYVFARPTGGWATSTESAKLTASDGVVEALFGYSVAIDGDTIVVGATRVTVGGTANQGAAYVYVRPAGGWASATETARLTASDSTYFGYAVGISGETIVVGAPYAGIGGTANQGAAYVFARPAGGWATTTESTLLTASDGAADDNFGYAVGISGATVVVGAPYADIGGVADQGAAYVFESAPAADTTAPMITISTPADSAVYSLGQVVNAAYACEDEAGGSGLASCIGTVPSGSAIDTGTVGARTFTVTATDNAGNSSTLTHSYSVAYVFSGFFAPVDNLPMVNKANGGQSIPIKFSLGGDYGLGILASGYPVSQQVACDSSAPLDDVEETTTANQGLTYGGGQYTYVWKTQKSWAGTCRQFTLRLSDGTNHVALFKFK